MMSYDYIRSLSRQAATQARSEELEPMTFTGLGDDAIRQRLRAIPNLGDYRAAGWREVHVGDTFGDRWGSGTADRAYLFVDSSGFGSGAELAMPFSTFADFVARHPGYGYAIVETGQFQVVIAVFEKVRR